MSTPDQSPKPIPDMPGFSRDADGKLIFDPFKGKDKPEVIPLPDVIAWEVYYYKPTVIFGYSPSDLGSIKKFLSISSRVEFMFCTTARNDEHSFNITYRCVPHSHTMIIEEIEVFSVDKKTLLHRFPEKELSEKDSHTVNHAIVDHVTPLAVGLGN